MGRLGLGVRGAVRLVLINLVPAAGAIMLVAVLGNLFGTRGAGREGFDGFWESVFDGAGVWVAAVLPLALVATAAGGLAVWAWRSRGVARLVAMLAAALLGGWLGADLEDGGGVFAALGAIVGLLVLLPRPSESAAAGPV